MIRLLLKRIVLLIFISISANLFAAEAPVFFPSKKIPANFFHINNRAEDSSAIVTKHAIKICSCQVLALQSSNFRRQKNIALFAEKTNGRNISYDMSRINRVMEKEKRHMQSYFYDKLTVLNSFTEHTDCKSLYTKLKTKNKYLVLYDILDADIRR
jgi:hypothetical protein